MIHCTIVEIPLSSNQQWCEAKVRISRNVTDMSHGQCSMARNILSMSAEGMDDQDHLQQPVSVPYIESVPHNQYSISTSAYY